MRRERNAATGSGCAGQGEVACGVALTDANVLSAIAVNDGKVFFSINVDAARSPRLGKRSGRDRGRGARHSRRHRRHDRADRRTQTGLCGCAATGAASPFARRAARLGPSAAAKSGFADVETVGDSRHCRRYRGGLRQGRRRQIDHGAQSGTGPARSRFAGRSARRRHLRAVGAAADRHSRETAAERQQEDDSDCSVSALPSCRSVFWSRRRPR